MTAICSKCGRDCRTAMALGKHEGKCDGSFDCLDKKFTVTEILPAAPDVSREIYPGFPPFPNEDFWKEVRKEMHSMTHETFDFTNWQETKGDFRTIAERCPKCSNEIAQFWKKDEWTWVCLECGLNFTPRRKLRELIAIKDGNKKS